MRALPGGDVARCGVLAAAALAMAATWSAGAGAARADDRTPPGAAHTFDLTYRGFGPVSATSAFQEAGPVLVRFEGCYAKDGPEAVCGFTVRAKARTVVSNLANGSHGIRIDGAPMRTCCLFAQGRPEGFPIIAAAEAAGVADLASVMEPGQERGFMLRLPDYATGPPLRAMAFSRGRGAPDVTFEAQVRRLP